ncbi:hypothetical protein PNO31109_00496 [Pandoraea nosoerga]|uniref:Uncharacterized protein n=1 Tax=Pandoraea nosoerga TaxID=2508296 RepID=A0A5E4S2M8_9BURK|nr:hypothetical protein PNO31109_00496 [Pandoraea nosoerga]
MHATHRLPWPDDGARRWGPTSSRDSGAVNVLDWCWKDFSKKVGFWEAIFVMWRFGE